MAKSNTKPSPAVASIMSNVREEFRQAAILSHQEVTTCLRRLEDNSNPKYWVTTMKAAKLLGLDPQVLESVLIEGLARLEHPIDSFHFEVLASRLVSETAPASVTR